MSTSPDANAFERREQSDKNADAKNAPDTSKLAENLQTSCGNITRSELLSGERGDKAAREAAATLQAACQKLPEWEQNRQELQLQITHLGGSTPTAEIIRTNV